MEHAVKQAVNVPVIYLVDQATKQKGYAGKLLAPMQKFVDEHFVPVWGTPCKLLTAPKPVAKAWNMVFIDNADAADALGYHEYYKGQPLAKIFVETTINDGELVSVTASHELAEMLVDPTAALTVNGPAGYRYAYETADAVEETSFDVLGEKMTNFITPQWFENIKHPAGTKYDYLGLVKKPFQLLRGGYAAIQRPNGQWTQIFGSKPKEKRWMKEDRRGHRNEDLRVNG